MSEGQQIASSIKEMSVDELTRLQYMIRQEKQRKHVTQGIRFSGYIPEVYRDIVPIVLDYLAENKLIKKRSIYNLATMSIMLVIEDVIEKIKEKGK
jgi:hypothetical protein